MRIVYNTKYLGLQEVPSIVWRRMLFLHVAVHRARYRELVAAEPIPGLTAPEPVTVACPKCGDLFVAELDPYDEPPDLEEQEWEGMSLLARECPDHPHYFETGG